MDSTSISITACHCPASPWSIVQLLASILCLIDLLGWFILGEMRRQNRLDDDYVIRVVAKCNKVLDNEGELVADMRETIQLATQRATVHDVRIAQVEAIARDLIFKGCNSMKHFISDPTVLVNTALQAQTYLNPALTLDAENRVLYRRAEAYSTTRKVRIISGGGSGHEPSFSGFVGEGLLDAGVSGTVFASPSTKQVTAGIQRVASNLDDADGSGVLVVVMNYTGDVLNFGLAVEKAKTTIGAASTKIEAHPLGVNMVVVADDVGVPRSKAGKVGRRGIAGTCMVLKIAGALAETGASLSEVTDIATLVAENTVSVGASLAHVHVPGRDVEEYLKEEKKMGAKEVEIGMGIHNEEGAGRKELELPDLVKEMLGQLLDEEDKERSFLHIDPKADEVVLMINNLGGISPLELSGVANEVVKQVRDRGMKCRRILCGTFMTSLNGQGFSISVLKLRETGMSKSMVELLDAPTEALGWSVAVSTETWELETAQDGQSASTSEATQTATGNLKMHYGRASKALTSGLKQLIASEKDITNYDTVVGDGDCGIGLKRGAEGLLAMLEKEKATDDVCTFLHRVIDVVEDTMDGTSGALYAIYLNAVLSSLQQQSSKSSSEKQMNAGVWASALEDALEAISKYTPAKPGDRTLMDALYPFVSGLSQSSGDVKKAAEKAREGAEKTKGMQASLGRTVYLGGEGFKEVPDPGAYGLSEFLTGLAEGL